MASPPDPQAFGRAIAEIRQSKGLTQKEVAGRIPNNYSDDRAYRRVERGERFPDRDAAIAILAAGLAVTEVEKINAALALIAYSGLTTTEIQRLQLSLPALTVSLPPAPQAKHARDVPATWEPNRNRALALIVGSVVVSSVVAALSGNAPFAVATAALYAALFSISLLLEAAMDPNRPSVWPVATAMFALMLASSVLALAVDARLVAIGNHAAYAIALGIYLSASALQWFMARAVLSESAVVPLEFQSHTAQAAHLKNTAYFLVIVVLFWLSPFHCVAVLQREIGIGHLATVKVMASRRLIVGKDFVALGPEWLWYAFLALGLLAIPMAARLMENLKSDPARNTYTALLYLRAIVYFLLILVCLFWYSSEIGSLLPADGSHS